MAPTQSKTSASFWVDPVFSLSKKRRIEAQCVFSSSLNPGPLIEHSFTLEAAEQQREKEEINTAIDLTSNQSPIVNGGENDAMWVYSASII